MNDQDLSLLRIDRKAVPRRRSRRPLWTAAVVLVLAVAATWSVFGSRLTMPSVRTVSVTQVYPSQSLTLFNATGYVTAQRKAAVSSKATGRLEWLGVLEGSAVREGEVIARLEKRDVEAARAQAAAAVKVAEANLLQGEAELRDASRALARSHDLLARGFIAPSADDSAIARRDKALAGQASLRAAIRQARAAEQAAAVAVEQTEIRAPFDGIVLTKSANVGDIVTPFSSALDAKGAVVTMADMSTLEVEVDVAESSIARIRADQPCVIQLEALPDERMRGAVSRIVPTLDRSKATLLVKVRFEKRDPRVLPEMSAKVAFLSAPLAEGADRPSAAVPRGALSTGAGGTAVFEVRDGRVHRVPVRTSEAKGDLVPVEGVSAGTRVVLDPPAGLADGTAVRVAAP